MHSQPLKQSWSLRLVEGDGAPAHLRGRAFEAEVPSCVHTVLMRAGAIPDPYLGDNETKLHWIGECAWEYRCTFEADGQLFDHERIDLCCDGLDTIATVRLNDQVIGRSENMHVAHRFDARGALRRGSNTLSIILHSPLEYARKWEKALGPLPRSNGVGGPFNFIRKMACNFGWDWGPVCVTSGIWKGVRLEGWSNVRLGDVVPHRFRDSELYLLAHCEYADQHNSEFCLMEAQLHDPQGAMIDTDNGLADMCYGGEQVALSFEITNPQIWHPRGQGLQPRYTLRIALEGKNLVLFEKSIRLALRTVELDTHPDDIGRGFTLKVNGKPIFCKGFNWIPDDCFLDRACTPQRYRTRIGQALDANANMLRVWGGGIYETDDFYDICDELGMLVWQDFPFACAAYPEEEPFKSQVEIEARENVARLAHHPSLVLWNGNNENFMAYRDWGWKDKVAGRTWGPGYYLDLLPKIMAEVDPSRPYWPGSPYSGDPDVDAGIHPNAATHGNKHIWEVWHGPGNCDNYRQFVPRFCSEFGYQAPPNWATFVEALGEENLVPGHPLLELHQKSPGGNARNERLAAVDFDLSGLDYEALHFVLQLVQARALTVGVEWFRAHHPVCSGTLYWQLNDCYPATSWSAIDSAGRKKLLWYATRKFFADRLLTIQPSGPNHAPGQPLFGHAINDTDEPWPLDASVSIHGFQGAAEVRLRERALIPPRRVHTFALGRAGVPSDPLGQFLSVQSAGLPRAYWFFGPDRSLCCPPARLEVSTRQTGPSDYAVNVHANGFVRDLCFLVDKLDPSATASEQMLTLLPGEHASVTIRSGSSIDPDALKSPRVLRCANGIG